MECLALGTLFLWMDMRQTRHILEPGPPHEVNAILRKYPQHREKWFLGAMVANAGVGFALPKKYRHGWWCASASAQGTFVSYNWSMGVRF